jgi:ABC-type Na+ efflux pump permease subunit
MNRYRRVWVVYRKELIDTLRDRRTLIAMVLVPIVLYPVLMIIIVEALRAESGRRQAEHYSICVPTESQRQWLQGALQREDAEWAAQEQAPRPEEAATGETSDTAESGLRARLRGDQLTIVVAGPEQSLWDLVSDQRCHLGVVVEPPPDPANPADSTNRAVQLIYCDTDPRSDFVFRQVTRALENESERIVRARISRLAGEEEILTPLLSSGLSTAGPEQQLAKILAMVVPFLLVVMTVTGAMYPAIDLTAGERERGTLETLAVSPVPVGQVVAGKFGVIVTIAAISTMLNLGSMTAMVHFSKLDQVFSEAMRPSQHAAVAPQEEAAPSVASRPEAWPAAASLSMTTTPSSSPHPTSSSNGLASDSSDVAGRSRALQPRTTSSAPAFSQGDYLQQRRQLEHQARQKIRFLTTAAPIILLAMIPFAMLFGAVMLATCSFARTFKEAQNYMMPVMMAAIVPAMVVSYMPTINLEGITMVVPVANVVILMRESFLGRYPIAAMGVAVLSTCLYAAAAVAVAAKIYGHEAVLFSDVGSYRALLRRRFFKPQSTPSPALALVTIALIFPASFYWQSYLLGADAPVVRFKVVLAGAQLLIFAAPVLLLAWFRKLDVRRTFSLRRPRRRHLLGAVLLALSITPVSILLQQLQFACSPPSAASQKLMQQQVELLSGGSLAGVLLVFALLAGVCEELAFRGFLLAGLRDRLPSWQTVLIVGVVFALFHVNVEKVVLVSLMGMLLALICLRSGSIYPAMLVHVVSNAAGLLISRPAEGEPIRRFLGLGPEVLELTSIHLDARTGLFLAVFLVGLVLAASKGRGTTEDG